MRLPPSICCLIFPGSPSAVFWFIISIVVIALDCMFWLSRPESHISQKVFKFMPTLANGNPSRPVIFKSLVPRIFAAPNHCAPTIVFDGITATATAMTKPGKTRCIPVQNEATTTFAFTGKKALPYNYFSIPAFAKALPHNIASIVAWHPFLNGEASKLLTDKISYWHVLKSNTAVL